MMAMSIKQVNLQRFSITSSEPFESVLQKVESALGHPDMNDLMKAVTAAKDPAELEKIIHRAVGPSGLMEFMRFNMGQIMQKESGPGAPRIQRLVVGNPLIMKQMAVHVHDAASYVPVTILIDERPDGVHLSYDRMASLLAPYGNAEASRVAEDLDAKVEGLLESAAR
jgi:uncharacterized protein (DUF302 family)